jgi:ketosteroid isomerase-like protein
LKAPLGRYSSPEECESAFYEAFRAGDLGAMQHIWGADNEIVCIHPARPPLAGRRAVLESWRGILDATGGVEVRFDCHRRARADDLAVHIGIEVIGGRDTEPAMVTVTNVYGLGDKGWKLHAHHAGPIHRDAKPRGPMH